MGEWILVAIGTAFLYACLEGILYLFRLRRRGILRAKEYRDPVGRFSFRYPAEWRLEERRGKLIFATGNHDGKIEIVTHPRGISDPPPEEFLRSKIRISGIEIDDGKLEKLEIAGHKGAHVESRAMQESERLYLQEWLLDAGDFWFALSYRCSVLYGLVDGFPIDQLVKSLRFGETVSAASPRQPE